MGTPPLIKEFLRVFFRNQSVAAMVGCLAIPKYAKPTTHNMIFGVTYRLELHVLMSFLLLMYCFIE